MNGLKECRVILTKCDLNPAKVKKPFKIPCTICGKLLINIPSVKRKHYDEIHNRVKKYFCRFGSCEAGFYQHQSLERHTLRHTKEKQGKCSICSLEIACFYAVPTHERTHFNSKLYSTSATYSKYKARTREDETLTFSCKSCKIKFSTFATVLEHIHPNVKCLSCGDCGSGFETVEKKVEHCQFAESEVNGNLTCHICLGKFDTTCARNKHTRTHRPKNLEESTSQCSHCHITLSNCLALQHHIQAFHASTTNSKPSHNCDECKIIFRNQNLLQCHQSLVHSTSQKLFHCHVESCSKRCETLTEYKKHIFQQHHSTSTRSRHQNCIYCDTSYRHSRTLRFHVYRHITDEACKSGSDCICKFCKVRFNSTQSLDLHTPKCHKIPKSENACSTLICYFCGSNRFHIVSQLELHIRRHVNERSYKCTICGKPWVNQGDLKKHMKSHSGTKNYVCRHCGKAFAIVENKIRHENAVHSVKKVACQICGKTFAHHNYLKDHLHIHDTEKKFKCKVCGKPYASRPNMYRHIREVHKSVSKPKE